VEAVAETSKAVLITGETGVGKELVARSIHALSREDGPFVAVNVAGFDDGLFADTLFGHSSGAYTGADRNRPGLVDQAAGGTLFLDEIGDLSRASQLKLLRLLESSEYLPLGCDAPKSSDARIIVATNRDLAKALEEGEFRKDLYYRLSTHHVHLPPLRERVDDIPLLVDHFVAQAAAELGRKRLKVPEELVIMLENHGFPGNVRELQAMVFDAVSSCASGTLSLDRFKQTLHVGDVPRVEKRASDSDRKVRFPDELPTIRELTDLLVEEALSRAKGRQTIAARWLGISQQALSKRLKRKRTEAG